MPNAELEFSTEADAKVFERYAYRNYSSKTPLEYWRYDGSAVTHDTGKPHRLVITNYLTTAELTINMALQTAIEIITKAPESPYCDYTGLSHRLTDQQIYDLEKREVVAKAVYDKNSGYVDVIARDGLEPILDAHWGKAWRKVHEKHPLYSSWEDYPYKIGFCTLRDEDEFMARRQEQRQGEEPAQQEEAKKGSPKGKGNGKGKGTHDKGDPGFKGKEGYGHRKGKGTRTYDDSWPQTRPQKGGWGSWGYPAWS